MAVPEVYKRALREFYHRSSADEPNDVCYWTFRIRKRLQIHRFLEQALRLQTHWPARLLDLGCAEASDLDYALTHVVQSRGAGWVSNLEIHGLDGSADGVDLARQWFEDSGIPADFRVADITAELPYSTAYFDVVICSEVVEHLKHPEHLLQEVRRILKPSGFLIFTTDNDPSFWISAKSFARRALRRTNHTIKDEYYLYGRTSPAVMEEIEGRQVEVYGHINTRSTTEWERLCGSLGFTVFSYGEYGQVRRYTKRSAPLSLALLFSLGFAVSVLPQRLGRHLDATTALLLRKAR